MRLSDTELGIQDSPKEHMVQLLPREVSHPVYATRVLCEVANERGVPTADVLAATAIEPADLDDPNAMVSGLDEIRAVRRLLARASGFPDKGAGIGIDVGSRFTLTHFGLFGFAVMSCGTLRELFNITRRYFALTMMHIDLAVFETADDCLVELGAGHLPADVRGFFIERDIAGIIATTTSSRFLWLRSTPSRYRRNWQSTRNSCGRCSNWYRSTTWHSAGRTTDCISRAPCSTSRCRRPTVTHWRCAWRSATC